MYLNAAIDPCGDLEIVQEKWLVSMMIWRELSVGFVVKIHVSYDLSVIYHEVRDSKPSVKVNLRDGYQISNRPRDELYFSVLISHEQVRNQINARWSFWVRVYFQIFSNPSDWHPRWSRRISSFETRNVNLCLWWARNSVFNFLVGIPMKQSGLPEWARISKKFKGWRFAPTKDDGASYNAWDK